MNVPYMLDPGSEGGCMPFTAVLLIPGILRSKAKRNFL